MREKNSLYTDWSQAMKRDWDDRARQDAKWFINTARLSQPEKDFDSDGASDVERLSLVTFPADTGKRTETTKESSSLAAE